MFEYIQPDADGELWYENPGLPQRAGSIELITEKVDPPNDDGMELSQADAEKRLTPFLSLGRQYHRLDGVLRVLKLSREYRPRLHIAWQQPSSDSRGALAVHLENTLFEKEVKRGPDVAEAMYIPPEVLYDGFIRLRGSHFLYLDVDMAYFPPSFENEDAVLGAQGEGEDVFHYQQADYVRMRETRRIRLDEIHYFDHPVFGLIIQVSRLR